MASRAMDDRRIFVVFLSIGFSISTLIPGLYDFLPESVSQVLVSPMVMGVAVLLITTLLGKIGTKRTFDFTTGVGAEDVVELNAQITKICNEWCTERILVQKLQIGLDALCEGFYEEDPAAQLKFRIRYDQLQIKLDVKAENVVLSEDITSDEPSFTSLGISLAMVRNMFDNVKVSSADGSISIHMDADV